MVRRLTGLAMATLLVGAAFVAAPVRAHDHELPRLLLEHDGQRQSGINYHHWWTARSDGGCLRWAASEPRAFPDTAVREPDPHAAIRLVKQQQPHKVVLRAWRVVGPLDRPVGPATLVETDVRQVRGSATPQWGVVFEPPFVGDNYLELRVVWKDRDGCGGAQGGYWGFHLFDDSL